VPQPASWLCSSRSSSLSRQKASCSMSVIYKAVQLLQCRYTSQLIMALAICHLPSAISFITHKSRTMHESPPQSSVCHLGGTWDSLQGSNHCPSQLAAQ
jgi:hypothetical protein